MELNARIFVAGGRALAGAALLRELGRQGFTNLVGAGPDEPCLTDRGDVDRFFKRARPEYVFLAAGRSGGITANQRYPADLMLDNLLVAAAVIPAAHARGARKLLSLASSCSYPRAAPQPLREEHLLTGPLEPTNEAYAVAKLAGIKLCQAYRLQHSAPFICAITANIFGPGDDFSLDDSHVIAALIRRMHEAKARGDESVEIWGTGAPRRDFIYADDLAYACTLVMDAYDELEPINIGSGAGVSIADLALAVKEVVGYRGSLRFDATKPDGVPVKVLDTRKVEALGWRPATGLAEAIRSTYDWFVKAGTPEKDPRPPAARKVRRSGRAR